MSGYCVLLAADSFKGSATSSEIEDLLEIGVRRVVSDCNVLKYPIADGGEGTVEAVMAACGGTPHRVIVRGPLGADVEALYVLCENHDAMIEMAQASGITLIEQNRENALHASTYGVGEMIIDALDAGAKRIFIGLGGSATSDGGVGMAEALGVRFFTKNGEYQPRGLAGLEHLTSIDSSSIDPRVRSTQFIALTDVSNPLTGRDGALHIYGPQKGVGADGLDRFDLWMDNYATQLSALAGHDVATVSGAGAAGGLGAALVAFCDSEIRSGIDTVLDIIGLENVIRHVDLVITGEGRMDSQSSKGKAPVGVAMRAKKHGVPVIAVVGSRADDLGDTYDKGIDMVLPSINEPMTLQECMSHVHVAVPLAAETAMRAFLLSSKIHARAEIC